MPLRRAAIPVRMSIAIRSAASAVMPLTSNGGQTSTTSAAQRSSSAAMRRSAPRSSRVVRPPGSGVPVPGANAGIEHVDVDGEVDALRAAAHVGDDVVEDAVEPARVDLVHRVPAEALRAHPVEVRRPRPRAAQAELDDVVAVEVALLDGDAERRAVRDPDAEELRGRVGVGVEVHDRVAVAPVVLGQHAQRRQRERVVAAEHERHRPRGERPRAARPRGTRGMRARSAGATAASP